MLEDPYSFLICDSTVLETLSKIQNSLGISVF